VVVFFYKISLYLKKVILTGYGSKIWGSIDRKERSFLLLLCIYIATVGRPFSFWLSHVYFKYGKFTTKCW